jgi:pachytene checkpoint protein 2
VEIDSHSLFSKWFGGSAKLVGQTFREIERLVDEDEDAFICILIDEVESLTNSRQSASTNEPGDGMRVRRPLIIQPSWPKLTDLTQATNALLTALDRLRARPNIVVLCTSNLIEAMAS